jgi:8-oxo-dGTP pyrophosphatase MutT (NUDIX family)
LPPRLRRCARAALRETWEETRVLFGGPAALSPPVAPAPIAAAYGQAGAAAALDLLSYVGRAITPARVFRRFNTRFFLGDGSAVIGEPQSTDELEDVGWHPIGRRTLDPFRDVSQFMLERAIALRNGEAQDAPPLFYTVNGMRRYGICREAMVTP